MDKILKVLIVEDLPSDVELAKREVTTVLTNFTVEVVDTKDDYVKALNTFKPDIIISDYQMPTFDGMSALKIRQAKSPMTPFIILTGSTNETVAVECIKAGADDYVIKEHIKRLGQAVLNAIEKKKIELNSEQTAEKLKSSEERLKILFESAPDAYFLSDIKGTFTDGNRAAEDLVGYKKDELIGKNYLKLKLLSAKDMFKASKLLLKNVQGKGTGPDEFILNHKDGSQVTVEILTHPVKIKNKTVVLGIARDISKRKKAEEILLKMSKAIDNSSDVVLMTDKEGIITFINPKFTELYGYTAGEVVGKVTPRILKSGFYNKEEIEQLWKTLLNKKSIPALEYVNRGKNGKLIDIEGSVDPIIDNKGNIVGFLGIQRDNTERKKAEEELKNNEEKFRSLVNNSPNIIMRIDSEGVIKYINYEYSSRKPEDIIGHPIYDFIPLEFHEIAQSSINQVFEIGKSILFENQCIGTGEKIVWHRNNIAPISKNGKVVAATIIVTDISEQKQAEIMQSEFIASISHELRTPLTTIGESLSLLSDKLFGELNSDQLDIVNPCVEDVEKLGRIINNLLGISQIEGQKIKLDRQMVDIVKLTQNTVSSFKYQSANKNIELVFTPNQTSIELYLDRDRIIQVFMNLIGNAIKFTKKGTIEIIITEKEDFVVCCIKDTGRGIEHKDLGTLFDRLHQVGKIMRTGEKGSGLGLSVVKGIVKSHKGKVWVNSEINKGSKFFFSLPKYSTDEIIIENIDNEIKKASGPHIRRSLLLVRLNNYSDIETKFDVDKANSVTKLIHQIIQDELAPGEFSFIKEKNKVVLFSEITGQNINVLISKLEDMLVESVPKIDKDLAADLSYSCSLYPDNGDSADELMQNAYKELLTKNKDRRL